MRTSSAIETTKMTKNLTGPPSSPDRLAARGQARHDVGEDEQDHALADAALGDELGEPHHEGRAGGQNEHHEEPEPQGELGESG